MPKSEFAGVPTSFRFDPFLKQEWHEFKKPGESLCGVIHRLLEDEIKRRRAVRAQEALLRKLEAKALAN